jgi:hypothetical protein
MLLETGLKAFVRPRKWAGRPGCVGDRGARGRASVASLLQHWRKSDRDSLEPAFIGLVEAGKTRASWTTHLTIRAPRMRYLSFLYRFVTNFAFLAAVYFSLNYIEKYNNRAVLAMLILVYAGMRAVSAVRLFFFYQKIERMEVEGRRLVSLIDEGGAVSPLKKQTIADVSVLRRDSELKAYMDLFFLALVVLLCVAKIVTD